MEAMRLSLLEHEAQQRREAEQQARNGAEENDSSSQSRTEDQNSSSSPPPTAEASSPNAASTNVASGLTPPISDVSPSRTPNFTNVSLPSPQPNQESPPSNLGDLESAQDEIQPSPSPAPRHATLSRMDSLASSVATRETGGLDLEGYRFLSSESEESVVAREPLLYVDESDV
jgi:hypothetical protein